MKKATAILGFTFLLNANLYAQSNQGEYTNLEKLQIIASKCLHNADYLNKNSKISTQDYQRIINKFGPFLPNRSFLLDKGKTLADNAIGLGTTDRVKVDCLNYTIQRNL